MKILLNYYYYYLLLYNFTINVFFLCVCGFWGVCLYARVIWGESVLGVDRLTRSGDSSLQRPSPPPGGPTRANRAALPTEHEPLLATSGS